MCMRYLKLIFASSIVKIKGNMFFFQPFYGHMDMVIEIRLQKEEQAEQINEDLNAISDWSRASKLYF